MERRERVGWKDKGRDGGEGKGGMEWKDKGRDGGEGKSGMEG